MKLLRSLVVVAVTSPVFAAPLDDRALQAAVHDVLTHVRGCYHLELETLGPESFAVADLTVAGEEAVLEDFLREWHGRVIAEEILDSFEHNAREPVRIASDSRQPIRVLRLDDFGVGQGGYNWERLNAAYPEIRAVVTLSRPAMDSLGTYAVVRYEIITREGPQFGTLWEFEKRPDGSWESKHGLAGLLRSRDAQLRSRTSAVDNRE